jgi:NAD(P)-dependent dehydrogenase (short-subunit alcohol dehydrogenase family)
MGGFRAFAPSLDCFGARLKAGTRAMRTDGTAVVTGAGKRIGAEIARALIQDGWTVIAHVHHEGDYVPEGAKKAVADLSQPDCAEAIFGQAASLPPVRLLINNAARFTWDSPEEFSEQEFARHMTVNVQAPVLLTQRFAREHRTGGDALIVNLLDSKLAAPNPDYLSYTLSKSALASFTDLAARALAPQGIRVNAIAPGLMLRSSGQSDENFAVMHTNNPLGRGVDASDVIEGIRYLVGAKCVTGQTLVIDSGHRFMALERDVQFLGDA